MKHRFSRGPRGALAVALAATAWCAVGVAAPATAAAQPLANGGFEQGLTGWGSEGPAGSAKVEDGGHLSANRLTHWIESEGAVTTTQRVTVTPGEWQTLSAWTKSGGGLASSALVVRGCGPERRTVLPSSEADDGWIRLTVSFKPSG